MLVERNIPVERVYRSLASPDYAEVGEDNNTHYIKAIPEFGGRFLRVVVNPGESLGRIVTFFFDRRIRT